MRQTERRELDGLQRRVTQGWSAPLGIAMILVVGWPTLGISSGFHLALPSTARSNIEAVAGSFGAPRISLSIRDAFEAYRAQAPMFDRPMSANERRADLASELLDAILRIEGVFDPTRIGAFRPALRMTVRAGTASMTNVFADSWRRADDDPNLHYRVRYLAQAWLAPPAPFCENFQRFRPDDVAIALDRPTSADCARLAGRAREVIQPTGTPAIAAAPTGVPIFAAPYPGSRFTPAALRAVVEARLKAVEARACFTSRPR